MRREEFKAWLENRHLNKKTVVINTLSKCKKVEDHYGDLDKKYHKDRCWGIIDELNYTAKDEKAGNLPRHKIPIGGNYRTNSASYKHAVRLYLEFCRSNNGSVPQSVNDNTQSPFRFSNPLADKWAKGDIIIDIEHVTEDEMYWDAKEEEDIRRNITG